MTNKEIIMKMLEMQRDYDKKVFAAHGISGYDEIRDNIPVALLDEIGEFIHELKPEWCWWKNGVGDVDGEKVFDEFADIIHFCLMGCLANCEKTTYYAVDDPEPYLVIYPVENLADEILERIVLPFKFSVKTLVSITLVDIYLRDYAAIVKSIKMFLRLSWEDIFEIYTKKHQVNLERLENGY